ncbi:agamous-like MADS-box protein AGL80 [Herrania umbratica]|uniref:Agamous-like MADS-box protein AGL80 n=1 Tax=Herrania umbratica TaxID=108875 RepID=A0A6J1A7G6_9ROSI|nr:agamous-like MADS-box protein AGL80 [Herrania umbratica]
MTRKKVKLAYITNDSARKATFKKRKKGLLKKVNELSTLCGIEACAIIYSPYDAQPEVWPSPAGAQRVLSEFKKMPEMEQSKKMVSQESFLRQRITKANEQLKRQCRDNREKEITQVMFQCLVGKGLQNLNMMDLNDLGWLLEQNLKDIDKRIDTLNKASHSRGSAAASSGTTMATLDARLKSGEKVQPESSDREVSMETAQRQQWIKDLMHPPEHVGLGSVLPFGDNNPTALWSNAFFP